METIKVLYNNCCGGFAFSKEFRNEYMRRTGNDVKDNYYQIQRLRYDPVAIAIFEERGQEWCSDPYSSMIDIIEVPKIFANYIDIENDMGDETVRVQYSEALADALVNFMKTNDRPVLDATYAAICAGREWMESRKIEECESSLRSQAPGVMFDEGTGRVAVAGGGGLSNAMLYGGGDALGDDEVTDLTDIPVLKISDAFVSDDSDTDN